MNVNNLKKKLEEIDNFKNKEWQKGLEDRKLKEIEYHDKTRDPNFIEESKKTDSYDKFYANRKYYSTVKSSSDYTENWIKKNSKGKIYLDCGCGDGGKVIMAAKAGAKLAIGIDISGVRIEKARRLAIAEGVQDNTFFIQTDIENTNLPDNSIEVISCLGMLHHVDISYAFPEIRRILGAGGKLLAVEALEYNPFIRLYRKLTPDMRTEWEKGHILGLKDVKFASRFFQVGEVKYWHVIGYLGALLKPIAPVLTLFDSLLTKVPFLKYMSWIFSFELLSKKEQ